VRGITVCSRSIVGNIAGGFMTILVGKAPSIPSCANVPGEETFELMVTHGEEIGCNAIINMRYDAIEVMSGLTKVLAYGTAMVVEKID